MTVLDMSLGGGVLIAAILVLRRGLLYRLPKWTFLLLWAVALCRLLIPFAVPSPLSVQTGAARVVQLLEKEEISDPVSEPETPSVPITSPGTFREDVPIVPALPVPAPLPETEPVSPLDIVRLTGTALCGLFFAAAYLWSWRRFWDAVPAESDFVRRWQEEHPTRLPVQIKVCGAVGAPLAYGLLRPVVLLPGDTDLSDEDQLTYVLTHEYVHIRRGDLLWKALLTAALCVHWFNPLVWIMYLRANQDLELACDEAVIRILGLDSRKGYAYALLAAAESGFSPLCITYTTKNHMEERIRAIMKMKKRSIAVMICAAMLVAGVSAVFATSSKPAGPKDLEDLPTAVMTPAAPDPAPATGEQDISSAVPERVHPITASPSQPVSAAPEQDAEPAQQPVEPIEPAVEPPADTTEPDAASAEDTSNVHYTYSREDDPIYKKDNPVELWGIPEGPIAAGTTLYAHSEEDFREMIRQLRMRGYDGGFDWMGFHADGRCFVVLSEDFDGVVRTVEAPERYNSDWTYRVNSKGETYGTIVDYNVLGYNPDLIGVMASNGATGYAFLKEMNYHGYQGPMETLEDRTAYNEWCKTQPRVIKIPVYDVNRDNVVGYYEAENTLAQDLPQERIDEILSDLESGLRRHTDKTEEEIAKDLEDYKQSHGWN